MTKKFWKGLFFGLLFVLPFWVGDLAFGATETFYLRASGDASAPETLAGAFDASDFNTAGNWDTDDQDDGKIGPNDEVLVYDDDGVIRTKLTIQQSGLSGKPITIKKGTGESPIVSGATLVTTWGDASDTDKCIKSGANDQCGSVADHADFDLANDFTWECWIYIDGSDTSWEYIMYKGAEYRIVPFSGYLRAMVTISAVNKTAQSTVLNSSRTLGWYHVALVKDGNGLRLYVNGTREANDATATGDVDLNNNPITVGSTGSAQYYPEKIDEVRISDSVRYTGTSYTVPTAEFSDDVNTMGLYHMDEGSGVTMTDSSSKSHDGTYANSPDLTQNGYFYIPSNVWSATLTASSVTQVFLDSTKGTEESWYSNINAANEWYWLSNVLYVYSTSDPDTAYVTPGIEWSRTTSDNGIEATGKDYITIEGLTIEKCALVGIHGKGSSSNWIIDDVNISYNMKHGIQFAGSNGDDQTGLTLKNSTISYCEASGINGGGYNHNWVIQNNEIHHCSTGSTYNFQGAIYVGTDGCEDILVEENYIHDNGLITETALAQGCGIWLDGDGPTELSFQDSGNPSIIRHNLLDGNKTGIKLENTSYVQTYNNIIFDCMNDATSYQFGIGIYVARDCHYNKIYNNVLYHNRINLDFRGDWPLENDNMTHNEAKNNIGDNAITYEFSAALGAENDGTYGSNNVYTYNCFGTEYASFIEWGNGATKNTYDLWETAYGGTTHSIEKDPLFTNAGADDFTLSVQSPCIDAGTNLGATYDDALKPGSTWPDNVNTESQFMDGRYDIGAFRYLKYGGG